MSRAFSEPPGRVRLAMADGRVAVGAWQTFPSAELVELCGRVGFDFVFLDGEHGGIGPRECLDLVRAADAAGIDSIVRVPRNEAAAILGYLESGVTGIVVPHIKSTEDANRAVEAIKYPP